MKQPKVKAQIEVKLNSTLLFKMGFHHTQMKGPIVVPSAQYWIGYGICFFELEGFFYLKIGEQFKHGDQHLKFDKVHELQNIFALLGHELKLK